MDQQPGRAAMVGTKTGYLQNRSRRDPRQRDSHRVTGARPTVGACLLFAVTLLLGACGGGDSSSSSDVTGTTESAESPEAQALALIETSMQREAADSADAATNQDPVPSFELYQAMFRFMQHLDVEAGFFAPASNGQGCEHGTCGFQPIPDAEIAGLEAYLERLGR
ncbi:MAG: hypothetical protein QM674_23565 [Burkholderiaceae bacterium]